MARPDTYDRVRLVIQVDGVAAGTEGTVIEVYRETSGLLLELDRDADIVLPVSEDDVEPVA